MRTGHGDCAPAERGGGANQSSGAGSDGGGGAEAGDYSQGNATEGQRKGGTALKAVRLGPPARVSDAILRHSLEARIAGAEGTDIVQDVRDELRDVQKRVARSGKRGEADKRALRRECKELRKEITQRERKVFSEVLQSSNVVACTCVGAAARSLRNEEFSLCVR